MELSTVATADREGMLWICNHDAAMVDLYLKRDSEAITRELVVHDEAAITDRRSGQTRSEFLHLARAT